MKQTRSFGALCGATCLLALGGGLLVSARAHVQIRPNDVFRDMLREWNIAFMAPDPRGGSSSYYVIRSMRPNGTSAIDLFSTRISLSNEGWYRCSYALTPDGSTVIYSTYYSGAGTYSQKSGRPRTKIMDAMISSINFSPDGRKIVYLSCSGSRTNHISVSNIDGTGERQLTRDDIYGYGSPCWSPDGRKILYGVGGGGNQDKLMVMNADGSEQHAITEDRTIHSDRPSFSMGKWSPDGSKIVAIGYTTVGTSGRFQVYTLNADGTSPRQLTTEPLDHTTPCWSPDGRKILYVTKIGAASTAKTDIFLMDADGGHQTNLTNTPDISETSPTWQAPIVSRPRL